MQISYTVPVGISIIMPAYNAESFIFDSISSILEQSYHDYELIIIDDCSTDRTWEMINSYKDSRVRCVRNKDNVGIAGNRNIGLGLSRGKYIAWLDADDIALPNRLKRQFDFLESNPEYGLCCTNVMSIDANGNPASGSWWPLDDLPLEWSLAWGNPIAQSSVMVRRDIIVRNGLCYRQDHVPAEDYNLWTELSRFTRMCRLPDILIYYRVLPGSAFHTKRKYALDKSYESNNGFITRLVGEVEGFHRMLTTFDDSSCDGGQRISYSIMRRWYRRVAEALYGIYGFSEREKVAVRSDISRKLANHFLDKEGTFPRAIELLMLLFFDTRNSFPLLFQRIKEHFRRLNPRMYSVLKVIFRKMRKSSL